MKTHTSTFLRSFLFLMAALPLAAATLGVLVAGWVVTGVLLVTPLVVPALVAFRGAVGLLAVAGVAAALERTGSETWAELPIVAALGHIVRA